MRSGESVGEKQARKRMYRRKASWNPHKNTPSSVFWPPPPPPPLSTKLQRGRRDSLYRTF